MRGVLIPIMFVQLLADVESATTPTFPKKGGMAVVPIVDEEEQDAGDHGTMRRPSVANGYLNVEANVEED